MKKGNIFLIILAAFLYLGVFAYLAAAAPNGATVTPGTPSTLAATGAGNNSAFAGNITFLSLTGDSVTQTWQGYFGNVSGAIRLADSSGNNLYNWSLAEPSGEVYASTNSSITWANVQCFNFTANGTQGGTTGETAGGTSLGGLNLTGLESLFNVGSSDVDGVNETFSASPGGDGHDAFFVGSLQFSAGECMSAKTYNSGGTLGSNQFEEALLYEPATTSIVFASILEQGALNGFNSADNDFQMLVLEDGHSGNTAATTYYFFVELA